MLLRLFVPLKVDWTFTYERFNLNRVRCWSVAANRRSVGRMTSVHVAEQHWKNWFERR